MPSTNSSASCKSTEPSCNHLYYDNDSYPKLYETVVEVAKTIILHYRHPDHIALYLHDLLKYSMSASQRPTAEDLFFLKVLSVMVVNPG